MTFINQVCMSVLFYAATSMKHGIRDKILKHFMIPSTATTMQTTLAAMTVQSSLNQSKYQKNPQECSHPNGLRSYGAAGHSIKICDLCGFRGTVKNGQLHALQPKAGPQAKTPLGLPKGKAKAKSRISASSEPLRIFWLGTLLAFVSGLFLGTTTVEDLEVEPPAAAAGGVGSATATPSGYAEVKHPSLEAGCGDFFEPELDVVGARGRSGARIPRGVVGGAAGRSEFRSGPQRDGRGPVNRELQGSADYPLTSEDLNFFYMKPGRQKRLLGSVRALRRVWMVEQSIYENLVNW